MGPTLNAAQRIMDGANEQQALISVTAHGELFGQAPIAKRRVDGVEFASTGPYPIIAKRGIEVQVFAFSIGGTVFLDVARPRSCDQPSHRWSYVSAFESLADRIEEAERVALVHLSASEILDPMRVMFERGKLRRLKELIVFMPNPKWYFNPDPHEKLILTFAMD